MQPGHEWQHSVKLLHLAVLRLRVQSACQTIGDSSEKLRFGYSNMQLRRAAGLPC
jgi:hypothetical protein